MGIQDAARKSWAVSRLFLLGCLAVLCGCANDAADSLLSLAPELSPTMARHLVHDSDEDFARYCADTGIKELIDARLALRHALVFDTADSYARSVRALMPHIGRLSRQLASQYGCVEFLRDDHFWMGLPAQDGAELGRLEAEMNEVYLDPDLLLAEKAALLQAHGERFRSAGDWMGAAVAEIAVAEFMGSLGNEAERERFLYRALNAARRGDLTIMTAQILGALGSFHREAGRIDSMAVAWNESMVIATRHRLPEHAAAIMSNYADYYASLGRLALAADRYNAAQEICREYKGGYLELRFILATLYFHAEHGHLQVVEQLLQRARVLQRESARSPRVVEQRVNGLRLDEMEARYLMSLGSVDQAVAIFERLEGVLRGLPNRYDYVQLLYAWSQGLLANRRAGDALPVIGQGLVQSAAGPLPATRGRFLILLALALRDLGNQVAALQTLDDFRRQAAELGSGGERALREAWTLHDACLAGIHLAQNNRPAAREALRAGLVRMRGFLARAEAGTQGYAFLNGCDELRYVLHQLLQDDPQAGYALELGWRQLPLILGAEGDSGPGANTRPPGTSNRFPLVHAREVAVPGPDPLAELIPILQGESRGHRQVAAMRARLRDRRAVHLVYLIAPGALLRWTASPDGVRQDTLTVATDSLRAMVAQALGLVSQDPVDREAPPGADLSHLLHVIATTLLPPEVLLSTGEHEIAELIVSPDGFLGLLPFAAYNLNAGDGYEPLVHRYEVAHLRLGRGTTPPISSGPGVILADPQPANAIRRRYPALAGLGATRSETELLATLRPSARILTGEAATKTALLAVWERASFIYAAAHFIRDPELPYLTFLPLSPTPSSQQIEESYLDIDAVRAGDLRRCRLVVLSGCASGAPYATGGKTTPGLGDALVDAGAAAVVDTYWRVRDAEAAELMRGFIQSWAGDGRAPEQALSAAQRAYLQGSRGARHPFTWAAYAVKLGGL